MNGSDSKIIWESDKVLASFIRYALFFLLFPSTFFYKAYVRQTKSLKTKREACYCKNAFSINLTVN